MHRNEESLSTKLHRIDELAKKDQSMKFTSLAHLLNEEMLTESYKRLNRRRAPGIDGVTMRGFGENAEENIRALHADDFVVSFDKKEEAERFLKELKDRLAAFNLTLAVDKTRLLEFGRRSIHNTAKGEAGVDKTFDFLGFTMYARKRKNGRYSIAAKPSRARKNRFLRAVKEWLRVNINRNVWHQAFSLRRKLFGYYNYFGLKYCLPSLEHVKFHVARIWLKTLRRRSQRAYISWEKFLATPYYWKLPKPALK